MRHLPTSQKCRYLQHSNNSGIIRGDQRLRQHMKPETRYSYFASVAPLKSFHPPFVRRVVIIASKLSTKLARSRTQISCLPTSAKGEGVLSPSWQPRQLSCHQTQVLRIASYRAPETRGDEGTVGMKTRAGEGGGGASKMVGCDAGPRGLLYRNQSFLVDPTQAPTPTQPRNIFGYHMPSCARSAGALRAPNFSQRGRHLPQTHPLP